MKKFLQERKRIITILAPLMIGIIYLALCLVCLRHSASTAEAYNAYLVRFDFGGIWNLSATGTEPPLYLFLLKIWAHVFGHADFVLRILSTMLGALAILTAYLWIKYKFGVTAAISSTFLLAIAPFFVRAGQEIGSFTLVILIIIAASFVLELALNTKNKICWVLYVLLVAAGLWTSYYCGLAWLAHVAYLAISFGKKAPYKQIALSFLAAAILWLPWAPSAINQINTPQAAGNNDLSLVSVANVATETLVYTRADELRNSALVFCLVTVVMILLFVIGQRKKMPQLVSMIAVPFVGLLLLSLLPCIGFDFWSISFVGAASVLAMGVAWTAFARKRPVQKRQRKSVKHEKACAVLATGTGLIMIVTSACGLSSVYAHEGYDLRLNKKHSADILYENIVDFDFNQYLPIVVKSSDLYYELSTYTTEKNPVTFVEAELKQNYGSLQPLRQSYFGKISNWEKFLAEHDAFWLVDVEPDDSAWLDFSYDGWQATTRSDLRFSDDGEMYQILKLEKEQI